MAPFASGANQAAQSVMGRGDRLAEIEYRRETAIGGFEFLQASVEAQHPDIFGDVLGTAATISSSGTMVLEA